MKKSYFVSIIAMILIVSLSISLFACKKDNEDPDEPTPAKWETQKMSFSSTYDDVSLKTSETKWRNGMVGGNGITGFITNGSPTSNVLT